VYGITDGYSTSTPHKPPLFDGHYLHNRSTLDIGVLGYIGIVYHKEHSPEVLHIPPGTPYIYIYIYISYVFITELHCYYMCWGCDTYGGQERCIQGFGGDTCGKETAMKT
jgi:hypothetical protein